MRCKELCKYISTEILKIVKSSTAGNGSQHVEQYTKILLVSRNFLKIS